MRDNPVLQLTITALGAGDASLLGKGRPGVRRDLYVRARHEAKQVQHIEELVLESVVVVHEVLAGHDRQPREAQLWREHHGAPTRNGAE